LIDCLSHIFFTFPSNKGNLSDDEESASNGARSNKKIKKEGGDASISEDVRGKVMAAVRRHFRPEFLNRYVCFSWVAFVRV
jgi:ATP-dependent Clp protease ATP-binding subunit ClpA